MIPRIDVYLTMKKTGIVPLFYHEDPQTCIEVITACYSGGARVVEFVNRGENALEVFTRIHKHFQKTFPDLILGAGTILNAEMAVQFIQAGAQFIVSPYLSEEIILLCNRQKIACLPGCATLTEISNAESLGCEVIKIFPGEVLGPKFIASIKGPCPWSALMPSGGVSLSEESIKEWMLAGAYCLGLGSQLFTKEIIETKNYKKIQENVALACLLVNKYKQ